MTSAMTVRVTKPNAQKILQVVLFEKGFHFTKADGVYTGITAISLIEFGAKLQTIDLESVEFHFRRQDFQKWIQEILGDNKLAGRISQTKSNPFREQLRTELLKTVQKRLSELKKPI
jgi:alpha-amylase